jgi:hypothetical protein
MKGIRMWAGAVALVAGLTSQASAQLISNNSWNFFSWTNSTVVAAPWATFTFNAPAQGSVVQITDIANIGDRFRLDWTGTTSGFFETGPFSGGDGVDTGILNADAAWADPRLSKGSALFGAGNYNMTLSVIRNATGFDSGGAFLRATTVPEPSTYALLATGLIALVVTARRRRV